MAHGRRRLKTGNICTGRAKSSNPPSDQKTVPENRDRPAMQRLPPPTNPWIMICHDKGFKRQTFFTASGESHRRTIPELRDKKVMACSDDWLVLSGNNRSDYSLLNIATFESIALPPLNSSRSDFKAKSCVLSSTPGTVNSMVLLFDRNLPIIQFYRLGSNRENWTLVEFTKKQLIAFGIADDSDCFKLSACCNGLVYVTTQRLRKLLTIATDKDKIVVTPLNMTVCCLESYPGTRCRMYLVESVGELVSINVVLGGVRWSEVLAIETYRLSLATKDWVKLDSCRDRVFLLGDSYNVSCSSSSELEGGSIFFSTYEDRKVYSYNIEDDSLSVAFCSPKLPSPRSNLYWIVTQRPEEKSACEIGRADTSQQEKLVETKVSSERDIENLKEANSFHLPSELLEKISVDLVLLDYMSFRGVCRSFWLSAPAIRWREASLPTTNSLPPWFIFTVKDQKLFNLVDPEQNGRYFIRLPPELENAIIHYSKDGWLLMSRNKDSMFFFNPFTRVLLPLPNLLLQDEVCGFFFSSAPTSSYCFIIGVSNSFANIGLNFIRLGEEEWDYKELPNRLELGLNHCTPVLLNGTFYLLCENGKLGVLTSERGSIVWTVLHKLKVPCNSIHQSFLVEYEKQLLAIFVGDFGKWVQVFRLVLSALVWKEVNSLGNHTVFLSRSSAFSVVVKSKEMGNRIYFPRLQREKLVFYSLETRKFHSSPADDSLMDYVGTAEQLLCGWIEPRWV